MCSPVEHCFNLITFLTKIEIVPVKPVIGVPVKVIYLHDTSSIYSVCLSAVLVAFGHSLVETSQMATLLGKT